MHSSEEPLEPAWARSVGLVFLALGLSVWAWFPMLAQYPSTATLDGRYFHHQLAVAKAAVLRYHELPLWNAFDCRGIPMWDHPENITASPLFWLTLPLSTTVTVIVWHLVHTSVGFCGMWLLARRELKLTREATFIAAAIWAFASGHTTQYAGAHEALISFYNAPLLLFLWRRAEHAWSYAVGCGLVLAWMGYDGATYPLPHSLVLLGIETLTRVWPARRGLRIVKAAGVVGLVFVTASAARMLPLVVQLGAHKRVLEPDFDHLSLAMFRDMYTLRSASYLSRLHDQQYVWGEYLTYVGWLGVLLALVGLAASATELGWLVAVGVALGLLMFGHFAKFAPWTLLHDHVFPFKSMRVPARFRLLLMMPISLWIALAADRVPAMVEKHRARWGAVARSVLVGLGLLVAGDAAGLGQELIPPRFSGAPELRLPSSTRFFYGGSGLTPDTINQPRQNRAYAGCRAAWAWYADAPLWEGDVPQARATDDGAVVEVANRTHNTFTLDVAVTRPSRIVLNSAYERSWRSDVGEVVEQGHLLALDLPPGQHRVHLRYWPQYLTLGLVISLLGLLGSVVFLFRADLRAALARRRPPPADEARSADAPASPDTGA